MHFKYTRDYAIWLPILVPIAQSAEISSNKQLILKKDLSRKGKEDLDMATNGGKKKIECQFTDLNASGR